MTHDQVFSVSQKHLRALLSGHTAAIKITHTPNLTMAEGDQLRIKAVGTGEIKVEIISIQSRGFTFFTGNVKLKVLVRNIRQRYVRYDIPKRKGGPNVR